jgi:Tol biopolymer transport system component
MLFFTSEWGPRPWPEWKQVKIEIGEFEPNSQITTTLFSMILPFETVSEADGVHPAGSFGAQIALSPDCKTIVMITELKIADLPPGSAIPNKRIDLWWINVETKQAQRVATIEEPVFERVGRLSWSPDGQMVAFDAYPYNESTAQIYILDAQKQLRAIGRGNQPRWSPDSRNLVYAIGERYFSESSDELHIWSLNTKQDTLLGVGKSDTSSVRRAVWWPNGKRVLYEDSGGLFTIDPNEGRKQPFILSPAHGAIFSPDGQYLAYWVGDYSSVRIVDLTGKLQAEYAIERRYNEELSWSPDSQAVLVATSPNYSIFPREQRQPIILNDEGHLWHLTWYPRLQSCRP